jgi:hypothetical protein
MVASAAGGAADVSTAAGGAADVSTAAGGAAVDVEACLLLDGFLRFGSTMRGLLSDWLLRSDASGRPVPCETRVNASRWGAQYDR